MDLTGAFDLMEFAWPCPCNLTGANLSGQNLANAALSYSTLTGADLSGAVVTRAWFSTSLGFTKEQLYSTASYQAKDLRGIRLSAVNVGVDGPSNLTGWNFSGQNLASSDFFSATLTNADLTGADTRGAQGLNLVEATTRNAILPNGSIATLDLSAGEELIIRDDDGMPNRVTEWWLAPRPPIPVSIDNRATVGESSVLQLVFDADAWDSTVSFGRGIPVRLGGALELSFADDVDVASQIRRTLRIFNWAGVSPTGQFELRSPYAWDTTKLYTTGEVTLVAVPEPGTASIVIFSVMVLAAACRASCRRRQR
jgi:hypothetical protein